jgi:hypothetical protein
MDEFLKISKIQKNENMGELGTHSNGDTELQASMAAFFFFFFSVSPFSSSSSSSPFSSFVVLAVTCPHNANYDDREAGSSPPLPSAFVVLTANNNNGDKRMTMSTGGTWVCPTPIVNNLCHRTQWWQWKKKGRKEGTFMIKTWALFLLLFFRQLHHGHSLHTPRYPSFIGVRIPKERLTKKIIAPKTPKSPPEVDKAHRELQLLH